MFPPLHSQLCTDIRGHFVVSRLSWLLNDHWNAEKSTKECMRMTPAHFTWENTTISSVWARVTHKFIVKMKPRRILHEKTQRFLRGRRECIVNVQSRWSPGAFYMRKHNDFSAVGGSARYIYSRNEDQAHFTWENTTISPGLEQHIDLQSKWSLGAFYWENTTMSPGLAGVAHTYNQNEAQAILHEKTQRFLRGRRECAVNVQWRWSPGAFYMRKHNDFSAVGGSAR